jgi:hypothetical protein
VRARVVAAAVGTVAVSALLTACDKPLPQITFLNGSATYRVSPQTYCFDAQHCRADTSRQLRSIRAAAGSTILVDVPKDVADQHWLVSAFTENNGQQAPVQGAGSAVINDSHSARVDVPADLVGGSYVLAVKSTNGQIPTGVWGVIVQVTS